MDDSLQFSFERCVSAAELVRLLRQTDWAAKRDEPQVEKMLAHTAVILGVWQDDRLVAFARVITDLQFRALIDDVVVDESFRGQGIGSEMLRRLAERLEGVERVFLRCEPALIPFYQRLGYQSSPKCMDLVNRD